MTVDLLIERLDEITDSRPRLASNGSEIVCRCPFCKGWEDFYVNPFKSVYHCFRCEAAGTLRDLLDADVPIVVTGLPDPFPEEPDKKDGMVWSPGSSETLDRLPGDHPAVEYVRGRGFDPVALGRDYGVGFLVDTPYKQLAGRLYLPIREGGKLIGWQLRSIDGVSYGVKYLSMLGYRRKQHLVYSDHARGCPFVVVCERMFDALRVGPPAVAVLGKPSRRHLDFLAEGWKTIVLLLDPDAAAEQAAATDVLREKAAVVSVTLNGYKDAGEAPHDAVWAAIHVAADEQGVALPDIHDFGAAPADSDPEIDAGDHKTRTEG